MLVANVKLDWHLDFSALHKKFPTHDLIANMFPGFFPSHSKKMCACPLDPLLIKNHIFVDSFFENEGFHFLTHAHQDHMSGLNNLFTGKIYCSEVTRDLVMLQKGLSKSRFVVISENHTCKLQDWEVVPIDSHHCDGSVMLVFTIENTRILYTGDFRFHLDMRSNVHLRNIDRMYYDDTLFKLDVPRYPCETDSFQDIVVAIENIRQAHGRDAKIFINTQILGVEKVLRRVADFLQEKFVVLGNSFRSEQLEYLLGERVAPQSTLMLANRARDDLSQGHWIMPTSLHFLCLEKDRDFKKIPDNHAYIWFSTHPDKREIARLGAVTQAKQMHGCQFVIENLKCNKT